MNLFLKYLGEFGAFTLMLFFITIVVCILSFMPVIGGLIVVSLLSDKFKKIYSDDFERVGALVLICLFQTGFSLFCFYLIK